MHRNKEEVMAVFEEGMNRSNIVTMPNGFRANYLVRRADGTWVSGQLRSDTQKGVVKKLQDVTWCYANSRVCKCSVYHTQ